MGFPSHGGFPSSLMVYFMEIPMEETDDDLGYPHFRNLHMMEGTVRSHGYAYSQKKVLWEANLELGIEFPK